MLHSAPIFLNASLIQQALPQGIDVAVLQTTASTNDFFIHRKLESNKKMHCCLAEQQTCGRGRADRSWHSPFAKNIYLSCCYFSEKSLKELPKLSLIVSLAIIAALKSFGFSQLINVKWPNDILFNHRKLAGILIEKKEKKKIIIGIGLNVNMSSDEDSKINQPWTSLHRETGEVFNRNFLAITLIQELFQYIQRFEKIGFSCFLDEWQKNDALIGTLVRFQYAQKKLHGKVLGINVHGQLVLELDDGKIHAFSSGEVYLVNVQK